MIWETIMVNTFFCATSFGTSAKIVEVESSFTRGLPSFNITGLANNSIQESKQRVQSALSNNGFSLPPMKININLFPSDLPKNGGHFDLAIALALQVNNNNQKWFAFGELGLDGSVKYLDSIYPLLLDISLHYAKVKVIVPECARDLLCMIPHLQFYFVRHLKDALDLLNNPQSCADTHKKDLDFPYIEVEQQKYFYPSEFSLDFSDVIGQDIAKRAALVAAAGFHNFLMEGSPGCGKSMIAKRLPYILPPSSMQEMIENVKHQALSKISSFYNPLRPFRTPHQSASKSSILGSATQNEVKPGEVALAHNGILFFDELPHFKKDILESLREPLENNKLAVSRVHSKIEYDTNFMFVAAQNPCPCGNLLSKSKQCRCQDKEIASYHSRLSEPFLDRIDIFVQMSEIEDNANAKRLDSASMQKEVFNAFIMQKRRGQQALNGKLDEKGIEKYCILDTECENLLNQATQRFNLSLRSKNKVKKLSRTIADLDQQESIQKHHILEALSYRRVH